MSSQIATADIIAETGGGQHLARLYQSSRQLIRSVAEFAAAGLERGQAVILSMMPHHLEAARAVLEQRGLAANRRIASGQLVLVDAETLLAQICDDGRPDRELFQKAIGDLFATAGEKGFTDVRVYGEMVEILRERGDIPATLRLQELWNETLQARSFPLLCGYRLAADHDDLPEPLTGLHSHVIRDSSSRERLLAAGLALFSTAGFDATTTSAIARRAGTSESQLIKHFGSKHGLLDELFESWWVGVNAQFGQVLAGGDSPQQRLLALVDILSEASRSDPALARLLLFESKRLRRGPEQLVLSEGYRALIATLDGLLEEISERGELAPNISPQAARAALIGAFEGLGRDRALAELAEDYPAQYDGETLRATFERVVRAMLGDP